MKTSLFRRLPVLLAAVCALVSTARAQGDLDPPTGKILPTMKTLEQIEPRIDLLKSVGANGVSSDNTNEFIIGQPGSYYLSGNLDVGKAVGIYINASNVTLDLNGFTIARTSGTGGNAMKANVLVNLTIINGCVRGFANGLAFGSTQRACIFRDLHFESCDGYAMVAGASGVTENCTVISCGNGIAAMKGSQISHCTVSQCTSGFGIATEDDSQVSYCSVKDCSNSIGIAIGGSSTLDHCSVLNFTGSYGIEVSGSGTSLSDCTVASSSVTWGIHTSTGCSLKSCLASANTSNNGTASGGISCAENCTLGNCTSNGNLTTASSPGDSQGVGIAVAGGCSLSNCISNSNQGEGIQAGFGTIQNCTASFNKRNGFSASQRCILSNCVANTNEVNGFRVNFVGTIRNCTATQNKACGILVESGGGGEIVDNVCEENGNNASAQGAGIRISGPFSRVEGNHVYVNWKGIEVTPGTVGVFIVKNAVAACSGGNFVINSGNKVGTIVAAPASGAINGSTGGSGTGSTDPWANISY